MVCRTRASCSWKCADRDAAPAADAHADSCAIAKIYVAPSYCDIFRNGDVNAIGIRDAETFRHSDRIADSANFNFYSNTRFSNVNTHRDAAFADVAASDKHFDPADIHADLNARSANGDADWHLDHANINRDTHSNAPAKSIAVRNVDKYTSRQVDKD